MPKLNAFEIIRSIKKGLTPPKKKKTPYMENQRQKAAREEANKAIQRKREQVFTRQGLTGAAVIGAGTVLKPSKKEAAVETPAPTVRADVTETSAPKVEFKPWRERTHLIGTETYDKKKKSSASKGITYKDVRRGRATAMQEMKSRRQRARMEKQEDRIQAEMSKPSVAPARKKTLGIMDSIKPITMSDIKSFGKGKTFAEKKADSPSPREEISAPGGRTGIGKFKSSTEARAKKVESKSAPKTAPTKKPMRADYASTTEYMAAYRAYEQARRKRN